MKKLYGALLGMPPSMDQAGYAGFNVAGQHVDLAPNARRSGMTSPIGHRLSTTTVGGSGSFSKPAHKPITRSGLRVATN